MSLSANKLFYTNTDYNDASNALINYNNLTGNSELLEHPLSKYARGLFFSPNYNKEFFDAINWANNLGQYNNQNNPLLSNVLINTFQEPPSNYSDISGLVAVYLQGDWDIVNNVWHDRSSSSTVYNAVLSATVGFQATSFLGNGSPINVTALKGGPTNSISFGNVLSNNYTVCSIARKTDTSPDPSPYADHVYFGAAATATSSSNQWAFYNLRVIQSDVDIMRLSPDPAGGYPRNKGLLGDSLSGTAWGGAVGYMHSWGYQFSITNTTGTEPAFFMKKDMSVESAFDGTQLTIELTDYDHSYTPESGNFLSSVTGEPGSWVVRGSWSNNPWPPNAVSSVPHGSNTGRIYNQILSGYTPPPPPIPPIISDGVSWAHGSGGGDLLINGVEQPLPINGYRYWGWRAAPDATFANNYYAVQWATFNDAANNVLNVDSNFKRYFDIGNAENQRHNEPFKHYQDPIPPWDWIEIFSSGHGYDANFPDRPPNSPYVYIDLGEGYHYPSKLIHHALWGHYFSKTLVVASTDLLTWTIIPQSSQSSTQIGESTHGYVTSYRTEVLLAPPSPITSRPLPPPDPLIPDTNWVVTCETGETNDSALHVNSDDHSGSNFEIVELAVWDRKLTGDELQSVSNYMMYNVLGIV